MRAPKKLRRIVYPNAALLFLGVSPWAPALKLINRRYIIPVDRQQEAVVPYSRLFLLIV